MISIIGNPHLAPHDPTAHDLYDPKLANDPTVQDLYDPHLAHDPTVQDLYDPHLVPHDHTVNDFYDPQLARRNPMYYSDSWSSWYSYSCSGSYSTFLLMTSLILSWQLMILQYGTIPTHDLCDP